MPKITLTKRWLDSFILKASDERQAAEFTHDKSEVEFGVTVTRASTRYKAGKKVWFVRVAYKGRRLRVRLGEYPHMDLDGALDEARRRLTRAAEGKDPRNAGGDTLGELFDAFVADMTRRGLTEDYIQGTRYHRKHFSQLIGAPAATITAADVADILDTTIDRGMLSAARRIKSILSLAFEYGIRRGVVERNPARRYELPKQPVRTRTLTPQEVQRLIGALREFPGWPSSWLFLLLYTGQRGRQEGLRIRWADIKEDANGGVWWQMPGKIVQDGKEYRTTKLCQDQLLYLVPELVERIDRFKTDSPWVWPSPFNPTRPLGKTAPDEHLPKIRKLADLDDFRPHDLRRVVTTGLRRLGCPDDVRRKITGHASTEAAPAPVADVHDTVYQQSRLEPEIKHWLERWAERLAEIEAGEFGDDLVLAPRHVSVLP